MGVDPTPEILDVCRDSRVPAELAGSDFLPESLPFAEIDLAYSFSVFTHISEAAAETCLDALHAAIVPGGLLILTIRPRPTSPSTRRCTTRSTRSAIRSGR
jgi:hypothetical protein